MPYIARIRKNEVLIPDGEALLDPVRRGDPRIAPSRLLVPCSSTYQAESRDRARRVVLVVRERPGELYPDHFWLLTSLRSEALLATVLESGGRRKATWGS